jgi:hypothetical protein
MRSEMIHVLKNSLRTTKASEGIVEACKVISLAADVHRDSDKTMT